MATRQSRLENKLVTYLGWDMTLCDLLELWAKVDPYFISPDETGIADYMVYTLGSDVILEALVAPLAEALASADEQERQDAINKMRKMGYDMTKLGYKR